MVGDGKEEFEKVMKREALTFDARAAQIKNTLAEYKGMPAIAKIAEGFISAEAIRINMLTDMESFVKRVESMHSGSKERRCVDILLAAFAKKKYGFDYDPKTGSLEQFYMVLGVDPAMHTLESLYTMPEFNFQLLDMTIKSVLR